MEINGGILEITRQDGEENRFIFRKDGYWVCFVPHHFNDGNNRPVTHYMNMTQSVFSIPPDELLVVESMYRKMESQMTLYFRLIIQQNADYPYPKKQIESLLRFNLTDAEEKIVQRWLKTFTYIYLIRDDDTGFTKIGRSDNPETRLKELKRQPTLLPRPNNFRILSVFESYGYTEAILHETFKEKRARGEWFDLNQDDIDYISTEYVNE